MDIQFHDDILAASALGGAVFFEQVCYRLNGFRRNGQGFGFILPVGNNLVQAADDGGVLKPPLFFKFQEFG